MLGAFDYGGNSLRGWGNRTGEDEYLKKEAFRSITRRPMDETVARLGEGRGMEHRPRNACYQWLISNPQVFTVLDMQSEGRSGSPQSMEPMNGNDGLARCSHFSKDCTVKPGLFMSYKSFNSFHLFVWKIIAALGRFLVWLLAYGVLGRLHFAPQ